MSPTTKTSGWPGSGEVGKHLDATRTVEARAGLLGDLLAQRAGLHAGRPHLGERLDAGRRTIGPGDGDAGRVDVGDLGAQAHVDAHAGEPPPGRVAEPLAEGGQHRVDRVERMIRAWVGSIRRKSLRRVRLAQLGDLPGHLDARRTGADDDEGQRPLDLGRRAGQLGQLEGAEDAAAQLERVVDRLHPGRVARELVVAEPRLPRARRRRAGCRRRSRSRGRAPVEVTVRASRSTWVTVPSTTLRVLLAGEHLARARGDLALREDAGRHLVEQRLEEVVGGRGDQGDLDVLAAPQRLRAEEASEAGTDDDDSVGGGHVRSNTGGRRGMPPAQGRGRGHHRVPEPAPRSGSLARRAHPVRMMSRPRRRRWLGGAPPTQVARVAGSSPTWQEAHHVPLAGVLGIAAAPRGPPLQAGELSRRAEQALADGGDDDQRRRLRRRLVRRLRDAGAVPQHRAGRGTTSTCASSVPTRRPAGCSRTSGPPRGRPCSRRTATRSATRTGSGCTTATSRASTR